VLLDYLPLIYGAGTLTMTSGIPSSEAVGTPSLSATTAVVSHPTRLTTISGGHVARPVFGTPNAPVRGTGRNRIR